MITGDETHFRIPGVSEPSIADIDIGDLIAARGQRIEDGDLLAEVVLVLPTEYARYTNIVRGRVLAVENLTLRVRTRLGESLVITDDETRFRIPGIEEPSITDISAGDPVLALGRPAEEGNLLARMVAVVTGPRLRRHTLRGLITEIRRDTLAVATRRGQVQVATNDETVFRIPGVEDPGIDDLQARDLIVGLGHWSAEEELFMARAVALIPRWPSHLRFIRGEVTAIEDSTIVLETLQGEVRVLADENTNFRIPGVEAADLDDLRAGDRAGVLATRTEEGALLAKAVVVRKGGSSFVGEIMLPIEATSTLLGSLLR